MQYKPSQLVRNEGFIQHVFRWGVGNKFRSLNKNRFVPVHHSRPKEVTIRSDYFDTLPPTAAAYMQYDRLNEAWEVYWTANMKLNAKPFPVKKFGVEESKVEAEKWMKNIGQNDAPTNHSDKLNVFWDDRMQSWFSLNDGGHSIKAFSAIKHGNEQAKLLAQQQASNSTQDAIGRVMDAINGVKP